MIGTALLCFYRTVQRHPLYAALNLLGLSFGIAVFIILSLFVRFETSYERWLPHAGEIYEATTQIRGTGQKARPPTFGSAGLFLDAVHKEFPDVVGTRIATSYMNVRKGSRTLEETGQMVDADIFKVFDIDLISGDKATALKGPDSVLISEDIARKYFGTTGVVGRTLDMADDGYYATPSMGGLRTWRITGVIRSLPKNSSLHFDFVRLLTPSRIATEIYWNTWSVARQRNFVRLPSHRAADAINTRLDAIVRSKGEILRAREKGILSAAQIHVRLMPLVDEHLAAPQARAGVIAITAAAAIALGIALINYVNLSTVRAGVRAREVALRKSAGATTQNLRVQFITEDLSGIGIVLIIAMSLVELALPTINHVGSLSLKLDYLTNAGWLLELCSLVLGAGLAASVYPAFVLSRNPAATSLASSRFTQSPHQNRVREALVVLQFFVVGSLFIVLAGLMAQLQHIETSNLGFSRNGILTTDSMISQYVTPDDIELIQSRWRRIPGVVGVAAGNVPGPTHLNGKVVVRPQRSNSHQQIVQFEGTAGDYFKTYGTSLILGRVVSSIDNTDLDPRRPAPLQTTVNVDINQVAVSAFGYRSAAEALGQDLLYQNGRLHIVGVVTSQRMDNPEMDIVPTVYLYREAASQTASTVIRFNQVSEADMRRRLIEVWHQVKPDVPISITSLRDALNYYYADDRRNTRLMAVGSLAAGFIGAIGLFGMSVFTASNRSVEIGIRKSLGASGGQVTCMLIIQFLKPVVVGNLMSWPAAYGILSSWLRQFDDRTAISPWFFVASLGLSTIIAVITVGTVALKAASVLPSKALRQF